MIDLHFHLLPGIDDGPATIEDAVVLARAAAEAGTRAIVATPHVNHKYRNDAATIATALEALRARLGEEELALEVHAGAEIAMTMIGALTNEELSALTLGDGNWVLLECPFAAVASGFDLLVAELQGTGHGVVLAHPERSATFHRDPTLLQRLVNDGALVSLTAGSLVGRFGSEVKRFSRQLVQEGVVHNVTSDAHNLTSRPPGIQHELEQAGLEELGDWLTRAVPEAILTGAEIPPRPPQTRTRTSATANPWWRRVVRRA